MNDSIQKKLSQLHTATVIHQKNPPPNILPADWFKLVQGQPAQEKPVDFSSGDSLKAELNQHATENGMPERLTPAEKIGAPAAAEAESVAKNLEAVGDAAAHQKKSGKVGLIVAASVTAVGAVAYLLTRSYRQNRDSAEQPNWATRTAQPQAKPEAGISK